MLGRRCLHKHCWPRQRHHNRVVWSSRLALSAPPRLRREQASCLLPVPFGRPQMAMPDSSGSVPSSTGNGCLQTAIITQCCNLQPVAVHICLPSEWFPGRRSNCHSRTVGLPPQCPGFTTPQTDTVSLCLCRAHGGEGTGPWPLTLRLHVFLSSASASTALPQRAMGSQGSAQRAY